MRRPREHHGHADRRGQRREQRPAAHRRVHRRVERRRCPGRRPGSRAPSSTSTVTRSSTRSTMIVAKAAVTGSPSRRASSYGRITSPARAGRTNDAAKPMTVVRSATPKRVGPSGASSHLPALGAAAVAEEQSAPTPAATRSSRAPAHLRPDLAAGWRCAGTARAAADRARASQTHEGANRRARMRDGAAATSARQYYHEARRAALRRCGRIATMRGPRAGAHRAARRSPDRIRARLACRACGRARCATSTTSATTLLIVATDRISAFDYVLGSGIPDKGRVLTQLSAFWFARTRRHRRQPPAHRRRRRRSRAALAADADAAARPVDAGAPTHAAADRVRRARLSVGIGLEGLRGDRRGVRHRAAGRAASNPTACPTPLFTPATKAESGHDINISEAEAAAVVGADLLGAAARRSRWRCTRTARRTPPLRHHPGRHQVRVRPHRRRRAAAHRRSDDAGLVALLAGGPVRAGRSAAELRQAVRARLPRVDPLEQAAAGAVAARRRRRADPRQVPGRLRAADRPRAGDCRMREQLDRWWPKWSTRACTTTTPSASSNGGSSAGSWPPATATSAAPPRSSGCIATPSPARSRRSRSGSRAAPPPDGRPRPARRGLTPARTALTIVSSLVP